MQRLRFLLSLGLVGCVALGAVFACAPPVAKKSPLRTAPDRGDDDDTTTGDDDDVVMPPDVKPESDPPLPDGTKPPGVVYAHTATELYVYDPLAKTLKKKADFLGTDIADRMLDIAVDKASNVYGTTDNGFVKIDPIDGTVTYVKREGTFFYPNALGFVPIGTVDKTKEALVGYKVPLESIGTADATDYVRIDLDTGVITKIGELNPAGAALKFKSSGDIISMIRNGNKAYVAIRPIETDAGSAADIADSIAEIDPATGTIKTIIGTTGLKNFWGLGQWAGTAYGFNNEGVIAQIDLATGKGTAIMTLQLDGGVAGSWFGAGVTTDAPTKP